METETTSIPMMIETENSEMEINKNPKKQAWVPTPLAGTEAIATNCTQIKLPEVKKQETTAHHPDP